MRKQQYPRGITWLLVASLCLNLLLLFLGAPALRKRLSRPPARTVQPHKPHFFSRRSLFGEFPGKTNRIVFVGDSMIEYGEWSDMLDNPAIANRGIGGDRSHGVLERVDELLAEEPAKVFMMVGINDISQGIPVPAIAANIAAVLARLQTDAPATPVYLHSVLPANNHLWRKVIPVENVRELNRLLRQAAEAHGAHYIDLYAQLTTATGELHPDFTIDGLHLNSKGYAVWQSLIQDLASNNQ